MTATYPTPATPLPWTQGGHAKTSTGPRARVDDCAIWHGAKAVANTGYDRYDGFTYHRDDAAYIVHAANAFPHLVAALEKAQRNWLGPTSIEIIKAMEAVDHALAIARGEVMP